MTQRIDLEKVAQVALDYALTKAAVGAAPGNNFNWQHALMGAGLGAGAGALSGLFAPGKDDEDETDRTGSAVMRGLLGGALGGAAGGFGGKYVSPYVNQAMNYFGGNAASDGMKIDPSRRAGRDFLQQARGPRDVDQVDVQIPVAGNHSMPTPLPGPMPMIKRPPGIQELAEAALLGTKPQPRMQSPLSYLGEAVHTGPGEAFDTIEESAKQVLNKTLTPMAKKLNPFQAAIDANKARKANLPFVPKTKLPKRG